MKIFKYPDGSSYAAVEKDLDKLNQTEGYGFTYRINSYEDLWHLGQILEVMEYKGATPIVTIPNLIDAQADRRFESEDYTYSSGLKMVCKFLNQYQDVLFQIFHPHNPEVVEALMDNAIIIDNSEFIYDVIEEIKEDTLIAPHEDLIIMSSDAGGFKPLMKLCDKLKWKGETFSASKYRRPGILDGKTRLAQQINREDFKGKDILIVDDISVYGGTFKGLAKMLRERNCGKLYLAVSHMTVQNLGEDPVTNYFDKVFTTNSKFDTYTCTKEIETFGGTYTETRNQPDNLKIFKYFQ